MLSHLRRVGVGRSAGARSIRTSVPGSTSECSCRPAISMMGRPSIGAVTPQKARAVAATSAISLSPNPPGTVRPPAARMIP